MPTFHRDIFLEAYVEGTWQLMGVLSLMGSEREGERAATRFCFDLDYALRYTERRGAYTPSQWLPVAYDDAAFSGWPPFLYDLFPQGIALKHIAHAYGLEDRDENRWKILQAIALSPPGNIRIRFEEAPPPTEEHAGFSRAEVITRGPDFLEHMLAAGAPISGSSGVQGAAPKFLLREDRQGRFHADGTLDDAETAACWIVKFPRGEGRTIDRLILEAEASYHRIAQRLGLLCHEPARWEADALFIPRFDRQRAGGTWRYFGLESAYCAANTAGFGLRAKHEDFLAAIARFCRDPRSDALEYLKRELVRALLGDSDNHGRNTALLKFGEEVWLSPLYDLAPMSLDPSGIVRSTHWERSMERPELDHAAEVLATLGLWQPAELRSELGKWLEVCSTLDELLREEHCPAAVIERTAELRVAALARLRAFCSGKTA